MRVYEFEYMNEMTKFNIFLTKINENDINKNIIK